MLAIPARDARDPSKTNSVISSYESRYTYFVVSLLPLSLIIVLGAVAVAYASRPLTATVLLAAVGVGFALLQFLFCVVYPTVRYRAHLRDRQIDEFKHPQVSLFYTLATEELRKVHATEQSALDAKHTREFNHLIDLLRHDAERGSIAPQRINFVVEKIKDGTSEILREPEA